MRNVLSIAGENKEERKNPPQTVREIFREEVRSALNLKGPGEGTESQMKGTVGKQGIFSSSDEKLIVETFLS